MRATVVLTLHHSCQEVSWRVQQTLRYKIGATRARAARKLRAETIAMTNLRAPLFVLSHMRSYSSLLSHVLGSHPDIDGYCETRLRYRFPLDVMRLHWKVTRLTGEPLRGRFVLDKILHNYAVSRAILENPRTRAVVLLREPREVGQSIIHMGRHLDPRERNTNSSRWRGTTKLGCCVSRSWRLCSVIARRSSNRARSSRARTRRWNSCATTWI